MKEKINERMNGCDEGTNKRINGWMDKQMKE